MSEPVTFVNVIDVSPERQDEVIAILAEGTEATISRRAGFVSVTILASVDRTRVINVARWESAEAARATQLDPESAGYAARIGEIAVASPGVFRVAREYRV